MPDLSFSVVSAEPEPYAATPILQLRLKVENGAGDAIHGALLRCQVRIEPAARDYGEGEGERLADLFGPRALWGDSQRPLLWTNVTLSLPPFERETTVDLPIACSLDLNAAATKLFRALEGGAVPLLVLFSGTVFFAGANGALQAAPIPWAREARFRLPVATWQALLEQHFPDQTLLLVRKGLFAKLEAFKAERGLASWELALESLLA